MTSQCYAIYNTRICVDYELILWITLSLIIYLYDDVGRLPTQPKCYGYQKVANLFVMILFNIHSFLSIRDILDITYCCSGHESMMYGSVQ